MGLGRFRYCRAAQYRRACVGGLVRQGRLRRRGGRSAPAFWRLAEANAGRRRPKQLQPRASPEAIPSIACKAYPCRLRQSGGFGRADALPVLHHFNSTAASKARDRIVIGSMLHSFRLVRVTPTGIYGFSLCTHRKLTVGALVIRTADDATIGTYQAHGLGGRWNGYLAV